jgi:hypothetical protein
MDLADFDIYLTDESGLTRRLKRRGKRKAVRPAPPKPEPKVPTTWTLSVEDLMLATGKTKRWLYAHADELPFVKRISRKTLRGDAMRLERWFEAERKK